MVVKRTRHRPTRIRRATRPRQASSLPTPQIVLRQPVQRQLHKSYPQSETTDSYVASLFAYIYIRSLKNFTHLFLISHFFIDFLFASSIGELERSADPVEQWRLLSSAPRHASSGSSFATGNTLRSDHTATVQCGTNAGRCRCQCQRSDTATATNGQITGNFYPKSTTATMKKHFKLKIKVKHYKLGPKNHLYYAIIIFNAYFCCGLL